MAGISPADSGSQEVEEPLPKLVRHLRYREQPFAPEKSFYLCGTAHISKKSCEDVAQVIRIVKPQVVMLELCAERRQLLSHNFKPASSGETLAAWRKGEGTLLSLLYAFFLSSAAGALEVAPGEEFRVALIEAKQVGARVVLGDRLVSVTIARAWASLSSWQRVCFLSSLLFGGLTASKKNLEEALSELEDSDAITEAVKEMGEAYPSLMHTLLHERNLFMVHMLHRLAPQANTVVAVVGAGHLQGMQDCWHDDIDIEALNEVPQKQLSMVPWRTVGLLSALGVVCTTVYFVRARRR